MSYKMTEEEFKLLTDFVRDYSGLVFIGSQEALFHKRIKKRIDASRLKTAREYYHLLRFGQGRDQELKELINLLTVNETYFFRETPQMEMIKKNMLVELKKKKGGNIRIWSAACSNGSEPYTVALLICESGLFLRNIGEIELMGTDINSNALQDARKGLYSDSALRATGPKTREKFFIEKEAGLWELREYVKKMVKFSQLNLFNPRHMELMRDIDLIFCRNVLIYFEEDGKRKVAEMLYECLAPGGFLVVGQTESLFKVSTRYEIKPMSDVLVYKKPEKKERT